VQNIDNKLKEIKNNNILF